MILENDANSAALGETWMGAGRGVDDLVLLTLGTGIGGGIIIGGRILHGAQGMAAELGHITVSPNGYPCGCGNRGCVEKHASATAIAAMGRLMNLGANLTAEDVYKLALDGNERALAIFRSMGEALGIAIASLVEHFQFPAISAERRSHPRLAILRAVDAGRSRAPQLHLPFFADAHRARQARQRGGVVWRGVPAVSRCRA